jgi:hypothetical protein
MGHYCPADRNCRMKHWPQTRMSLPLCVPDIPPKEISRFSLLEEGLS